MKFGILKTAIENKMVKSFAKNELTENFKTFRKTILGNSKLKKLYFIYDKLNENLGVDQTTASIILEELSNEIKSIWPSIIWATEKIEKMGFQVGVNYRPNLVDLVFTIIKKY